MQQGSFGQFHRGPLNRMDPSGLPALLLSIAMLLGMFGMYCSSDFHPFLIGLFIAITIVLLVGYAVSGYINGKAPPEDYDLDRWIDEVGGPLVDGQRSIPSLDPHRAVGNLWLVFVLLGIVLAGLFFVQVAWL